MLMSGEPLVELDVSETQLDVDKLGQDLAIKENRRRGPGSRSRRA